MSGTAPPVGDPAAAIERVPALQHGADVDAWRLDEALRAAGPALLFGLHLWGSALFLEVPSLINWLRS
jgi:hypothetical protein